MNVTNQGMPRRDQLRQAFEMMDLNNNQSISKEELFQYLDMQVPQNPFHRNPPSNLPQNNGQQFDRDIGDQLSDRMDKNHDQQITLNEFIKVFVEAENVLMEKMEQAQKNVEDFKKQQMGVI